jgi:mannose-6-phosphate isomerase-like protein (cupin superfamily)/dienelactone hydrolase
MTAGPSVAGDREGAGSTAGAPEQPGSTAAPLVIRAEDIEPFSRGAGVVTLPYVGAWISRDCRVTTGVTVFPAGAAIGLHTHNVEESVLVLQGRASVTIGSDVVELDAGAATWVPAGMPHRFANSGDGELRIYWTYAGHDITRTLCATGETVQHLSAGDRGAVAGGPPGNGRRSQAGSAGAVGASVTASAGPAGTGGSERRSTDGDPAGAPASSGPRILDPVEFYRSGATTIFASRDDPRLSYCLYVPTAHRTTATPLPLMVIVHGTARTAERYRTLYSDFAEQHGAVVLAPLFPAGLGGPADLHGYKRIAADDIRYDTALLAIVSEVGERWRVATDRFLLHGFSGGGQFSHRLAYLHPDRLLGVSIGAPGRVTRINPDVPWWLGTADLRERFGIDLDLAALRQVPVQMLVGDADVETWEIAEPGLDAGGDTRIERLTALHRNWTEHGIGARFDLVPGVAHSGSKMVEHVQRFFHDVLATGPGPRA